MVIAALQVPKWLGSDHGGTWSVQCALHLQYKVIPKTLYVVILAVSVFGHLFE